MKLLGARGLAWPTPYLAARHLEQSHHLECQARGLVPGDKQVGSTSVTTENHILGRMKFLKTSIFCWHKVAKRLTKGAKQLRLQLLPICQARG